MGHEVSKIERARDNKDRIGAAIDSVNFHVHSLTHTVNTRGMLNC